MGVVLPIPIQRGFSLTHVKSFFTRVGKSLRTNGGRQIPQETPFQPIHQAPLQVAELL